MSLYIARVLTIYHLLYLFVFIIFTKNFLNLFMKKNGMLQVYGRKLGFQKLYALILLGDVQHQRFLHSGSSFFMARPLILHVGRLIQVLILPLFVTLSLTKVVIVGELLVAIIPTSYIIELIHDLSQLAFHYALPWTMDTSTTITSMVWRCGVGNQRLGFGLHQTLNWLG